MSLFFPLYHYSLKFFFSPSIMRSLLPSLFPLYHYFFPSTEPLSLVLFFPHLPLFYPFYHCSFFLSFSMAFSRLPSRAPFCHRFFPSIVTPSLQAIFFPLCIIFSLLPLHTLFLSLLFFFPLFFPLCHRTLPCAITLSPLPFHTPSLLPLQLAIN